MAMITCVFRLFQADLYAVFGCIEEPHALFSQAVREMISTLKLDE